MLALYKEFITRTSLPGSPPLWLNPTITALIIRIAFWGPLYYNYNKEPLNGIGIY